MKVALVLITGSNYSTVNCLPPEEKEYSISGKTFCARKSTHKLNVEEVGEVEVDLLWLRPSRARPSFYNRDQVRQLSLLRPKMNLSGGLDDGYILEVDGCPDLKVKLPIPSSGYLVVLIRHWVSVKGDKTTGYDDITGFDWQITSPFGALKAKMYLGDSPPEFLFGRKPYIFLAGLRFAHEKYLIMRNENELWFDYFIESVVRSYLCKLEEISGQALKGADIDEKSLAETIPQSRPNIDNIRGLVVWIYNVGGAEANTVRRALKLPGRNASRLVVVPSEDVRPDFSDEEVVGITDNIEVTKGDFVLSHGFVGMESLKAKLTKVGIDVMDYSPGEESWDRYVGAPLRRCETGEEVRRIIVSYVLRNHYRKPADLLRRILHRSVNRLAPLRIDVAVLGELARSHDRLGLVDQLSEMRTAWLGRPENRPLHCLASLHAMLVGRATRPPADLSGEDLPATDQKTDEDALFEQLVDRGDVDQAGELLAQLIVCAGLKKDRTLDKSSPPWRYLHRLEREVLRADTDQKSLKLAGDLINSARDVETSDLITKWAGLKDFSYAAWLEKISILLEMLYRQVAKEG